MLTDIRDTSLVQNNDAKITNDIKAEVETGDNSANDNTNGNVSITTGDANSTVSVDNMANFNVASVDCCLVDLTAKIAGNGSDSTNHLVATLADILEVFQGGKEGHGNQANLDNKVDPEVETGDNYANRNTGPVVGDDMAIVTGSAADDVAITNSGNANVFGQGTALTLPGGLGLNLGFDLHGLLALISLGAVV